MNGMPFDMVLAQPLAETFKCGGNAIDVGSAHNMAWNALTSSLGADPIEAWTLKVMEHVYDPNPAAPGVQFIAEFVRNPEYDGPI